MNLISAAELKNTYLKDNLWQVSHSDGIVPASKILEYLNPRTGRDVLNSLENNII